MIPFLDFVLTNAHTAHEPYGYTRDDSTKTTETTAAFYQGGQPSQATLDEFSHELVSGRSSKNSLYNQKKAMLGWTNQTRIQIQKTRRIKRRRKCQCRDTVHLTKLHGVLRPCSPVYSLDAANPNPTASFPMDLELAGLSNVPMPKIGRSWLISRGAPLCDG
jgi:hypothetical protein